MFCFCVDTSVFGLFRTRATVCELHSANTGVRYNVSGARRRTSLLKVFAMWYTWTTLLLVSSALVVRAKEAAETPTAAPAPVVTTTRGPPRTLDRQAAELAWRSWLQSPESGNQNAPPRRITTKSLFITPLVCPKGQRLDRNGCVQVVTVNKDEHERILLEQLNALFTSAPSGDVVYDYGDEEPGPLQLSFPIGLDLQAAPLQNQELSGQAHDQQPTYIEVDKKDDKKPIADTSIVAELELLKLQHSHNHPNDTIFSDDSGVLNHNVLNNFLPFPDKPKRDTIVNETDIENVNSTEEGQKELVYGHVNVDPVVYDTEYQNANNFPTSTFSETEMPTEPPVAQLNASSTVIVVNATNENVNAVNSTQLSVNKTKSVNTNTVNLKTETEQTKLNPENDYSNIGEAIKLISRYAEVSTDDNFTKDRKKHAEKDEGILGTRTKLQYRRNRPKSEAMKGTSIMPLHSEVNNNEGPSRFHPKGEIFYRYPWSSEHSPTPPPNYPFRHLQDYWQGRNQVGGIYKSIHENPRRHHHTYSHTSFRSQDYPYPNPYAIYPRPHYGLQETYPNFQNYPHRVIQRYGNPMHSMTNNQDLYSLLGLRHWFSSEGTSKR